MRYTSYKGKKEDTNWYNIGTLFKYSGYIDGMQNESLTSSIKNNNYVDK
jgi:hypothetical protein